MIHELKTWPEPFQAVLFRTKKHEYRKHDRVFAQGDTLRLREWSPDDGYTGREAIVYVTYISTAGQFGIPEGYCVMSISLDGWIDNPPSGGDG